MNGTRKGEWWECSLKGLDLTNTAPAAWPKLLAGKLHEQEKLLMHLQRTDGLRVRGNRVLLRLFPQETSASVEQGQVEVLYEDDFCLVVNKPAYVKVHPTEPGETGTLLQQVAAYAQTDRLPWRPRHIHRLDEQTSGAVLMAKCDWAQRQLDAAMRLNQIGRRYMALASGRLDLQQGTIKASIGRDRHHPTRRRISPRGDQAITHFVRVELLGRATLVEVELETGRTHQIRLHLQHIGHPLFGDKLYGGPLQGIERQALHSSWLSFPHPWSGETVQVDAPWPTDFAALYAQLKK